MAQSRASSQRNSQKPKKNSQKAATPSKQPQRGRNQVQPQAKSQPLVDDRARRDITGIAFIVLGVVLFVAAILRSDAVVTSFISQALHLSLGIGAYLLPIMFVVIGASMFVRFDRERVPTRAAVGLVMIVVAILALTSLFTPGLSADTAAVMFEADELVARGGYLGAGIAWVGVNLFGQIISCIIMFGVMFAGLIVIGFSISNIIERVQQAHLERMEKEEAAGQVMPAPPLVRRPAYGTQMPLYDEADPLSQAQTQQFEEETSQTRRITQGKTRRHSASFDSSDFEAHYEPNEQQMLTRKLGKKQDEQAEAQTKPLPKKKSNKKAEVEQKPAVSHPTDGFELPPANMLTRTRANAKNGASEQELRATAMRLQETLEDFGIMAQVVGWTSGPTVTLFKIDLPAGVRVSRVTALNDDIALALAAPGVRIFAPIPGTNYVGIEVPNATRQMVHLADVLDSAEAGPLQVAIGKDVEGNSIVSDLASMPHVLIAGTTGSGKSFEINAMIMSILMRATPSEVRFIMVDPKRVEFEPYNGIPHLYVPVVTECGEASAALGWAVAEMERRLKLFSKVGVRNILSFNEKAKEALAQQEAQQQTHSEDNAEASDEAQTVPFETSEQVAENPYGDPLPYIVIVIDELADLMMNVGKEVEFSISRIAQLARAAGIHLIIATQRPSTNVVTGLIKANITCRIGLTVASGIDSRVILDTTGAEDLCGKGDLLFSKPEYAKPVRTQGPFVSDEEIASVVNFWKAQGEPEYHSEILQTNMITLGASAPDGSGGHGGNDDPLIWEAADIVVSSGLGSTSAIQRRLSVGYARAGRIMDMLEAKGIVGPPNGSKPRDVLVDAMELETLKAFEMNDE